MKLLQTLCQTPSVPGREHRMRQVIQEHTKYLFDDIRVDAMGSMICTRQPRPARKKRKKPLCVMIAAHMDQIGFIVRHIDDKGFLRVQNVGSFDTRNLFGRLVTVCPDPANGDRDLPGVMNPSGKPIHIASVEEKNKIPEIHDLVIDLGLDVKQVKKKVRIGDMVVIQAPFTRVGRTIVGQCMDNRTAVWTTIRAIEKLAHHDCQIVAAFTVQEEVGCRGAGPAADSVQPDVAVSLDTTLCVDVPGVAEDQRVTTQGQGAGLVVLDSLSITDLQLLEAFEALAKKKKIKTQRAVLGRGTTDAAAIQRKASGYRVMTLVCPTRYIHTATEMIHLDDLYATRDLLAAYLAGAG